MKKYNPDSTNDMLSREMAWHNQGPQGSKYPALKKKKFMDKYYKGAAGYKYPVSDADYMKIQDRARIEQQLKTLGRESKKASESYERKYRKKVGGKPKEPKFSKGSTRKKTSRKRVAGK